MQEPVVEEEDVARLELGLPGMGVASASAATGAGHGSRGVARRAEDAMA